MSRRIRPSARKKTLGNVLRSDLSETDKQCIQEVFKKFDERSVGVRCVNCEKWDKSIRFFNSCACSHWSVSKDVLRYTGPDDYCSNGVPLIAKEQ